MWDFGDGARGSGVTAAHTYTSAGTYTLALTVGAPDGAHRETKTIVVASQPRTIPNGLVTAGNLLSGHPAPNPLVRLPQAHATPPAQAGGSPGAPTVVVALTAVVAAVIIGGGALIVVVRRGRRRRRRERRAAEAERRRRVAAAHALADHGAMADHGSEPPQAPPSAGGGEPKPPATPLA
jgi:PKD repeat protein